MMETEFIVLTIALIVSSLICIYCGVKFVIGFVAWKKLRAVRPYIPESEYKIAHKQSYQKADGNTRSKGVQVSPFCISMNNPYNNSDKYGKNPPYPTHLAISLLLILSALYQG